MAMETAIPTDHGNVPAEAKICLAEIGAPGTFKSIFRLKGNICGRREVEEMSPEEKNYGRRHHQKFPRHHHCPRRIIGTFIQWAIMKEKETMHAQDKARCHPCLLHLYRRRCGSRSLVGCGLLRSYSGVYLASIPIRGSGAVLAGYAIPEVTGE